MSSAKERLLYAFTMGSSGGYLDREKSFLSGNIEASDLINEEFPGTMSFY